ncbi:hypothetical protein GWK47_047849 [Chionoecetes opilio]|uniref:Uncharacterized protein n=1 Tax=Chionoecetes opilio TaxID=41210 RepID=A0A8J4YAT1_CHIOP|nr:hypothetical protein GWK47_047849 [Chionoecetes opilio]
MIGECRGKLEILRVMSVPKSVTFSPQARTKDSVKRSSSSPAAALSDRGKSAPSSPQQNFSFRPPNSHDNEAVPATTPAITSCPSRPAACPEPSPQPQCSRVLGDTDQDVNLSEDGAEGEINARGESNSRHNSFHVHSIPHVDDPSDSDKERHVTKLRTDVFATAGASCRLLQDIMQG